LFRIPLIVIQSAYLFIYQNIFHKYLILQKGTSKILLLLKYKYFKSLISSLELFINTNAYKKIFIIKSFKRKIKLLKNFFYKNMKNQAI